MNLLALEAGFALVGLSCVPFCLWYFGGKVGRRNAALCLASAASAALAVRAEGAITTLALLELSSLLLALVLLKDGALLSVYLSVQVMSGTAALSGLALAGCGGYRELGVAVATLGMLLKAGAFPLHFWLPRVHGDAPAPASALLSSVAVAGGAMALSRLIPPGEASGLLFWSGAASILWGTGQGLMQRDSKRALAYSTVAAMGVALVLASRGEEGRLALSAHLLAHALYKATLFMAVGVVEKSSGRDLLLARDPFRGAWPIPVAMVVAIASALGTPATIGFSSKELSKEALLQVGKGMALLAGVAPTVVLGRLLALLVAGGLGGLSSGALNPRRDLGVLLLSASLLLPILAGLPPAERARAWAGEAALALKLSIAAYLLARPLARPWDLEDLLFGRGLLRMSRLLAGRASPEREGDESPPYPLAILAISLALLAVAVANTAAR